MKKLFLIIAVATSTISFSQSVKVENGKAIQITPAIAEKKQTITEQQLEEKLSLLKQDRTMLLKEIERTQKELAKKEAQIAECEAVCKKLGYK